jgi:hypothetical protein
VLASVALSIADPSFADHKIVIHYSTIFDGKTPAACGAKGTPCPAASEWCYVTCAACLATKPADVHARQNPDAVSLSGLPPDDGEWTARRSRVTCIGCLDEIGRRSRATSPSPPRH